MTNFKQILELAIEKRADDYSESMSRFEHQPSAFRGFLKGAALPSELLLLAIEALDGCSKCTDEYLWTSRADAKRIVEQIRTRLEGVK